MSQAQAGTVLSHLQQLAAAETTRGLTDGQLLERFVACSPFVLGSETGRACTTPATRGPNA
jgi:hypothetical protein